MSSNVKDDHPSLICKTANQLSNGFTTENEYTGNGSTTKYSFSFPYIISSDIKATIEDVNGNPIATNFTLVDPTTVEFTTPPANGRKVQIFRLTNVDNVQTQFSLVLLFVQMI